MASVVAMTGCQQEQLVSSSNISQENKTFSPERNISMSPLKRTYWIYVIAAIALFILGTLPAFASITSLSGNVIYIDTAGNVQPNLRGNYVNFNVTNNTGSAIADAWVTIDSFSGGYVSKALYEPGSVHLGQMANGASKVVYFYLNVDCSSFNAGRCDISTAQTFSVNLYSGPPATNLVDTHSFSMTAQETTAANANKVTTVVTSTTDPQLGSLIIVTVTGNTGTISSDKFFYESPQTYYDFPAGAFRLYKSVITLSGANTGTYTDQLLLPISAFASTAATDYSCESTYLVAGPTADPTAVSPVAFITSGGQVKHTDTSAFSSASIQPIPPTSNSLTVSKLIDSSIWPTGGTPTFTIRFNNAGSSDTSVDDIVDTLPSGINYVPGSSTYNGTSISDPLISGNTVKWYGIFSVPAHATVNLTFRATVPNVAGLYTNSAYAEVGSTKVDTTTQMGDDSQATVNFSVGSPDLTVGVNHTGNFTQGETGATYSITVSNIGSGPTSGTVALTDTLPTGLTATAISGTGWTCTLTPLSCTRSDALAGGSSYPTITLTVNVASNAASSVTNTVAVSGGGDANNSNNGASDLTTITQLPDLTVGVSHTGSFTQGETGATYTITVSNIGSGSTSGVVTLTDSLPSGLTTTAISGMGWTCTLTPPSCTRSDVLVGGGSYPAITLTVNVASNAASSVTNTAAVSGGGDANNSNNGASDLTSITALSHITATTLVISPASANAGATVTLTATVLNQGTPVFPGTVDFCDATASRCEGTALLGTVQLTSNGTAVLKHVFAVGSYSIKAAFTGTPQNQSSESQPQGLVVSGNSSYSTRTTISASGDANGYTLTATVAAFGKPVAVGTVSFLDTSNSNAVLGAASLDPATLSFTAMTAANSQSVAGSTHLSASSDLNGDGNVDFVVTDQSSNTVSVLLGNGDGTLQPAVTYSTDSNGHAHAVTVGDFNGDGNIDLAVANFALGGNSPSVSILLGNGDGTFQSQTSYTTGNGPSAVGVADLNGDGNADLIITNSDDNTVSVLLGNGGGTFQSQTTIAVGNNPAALTVADLNDDGNADLVVANRTDNTVGVLLGGGDGTFASQVSYATGSSPSSVTVADLNNDGNSDIIVTNSSDNTVSVLRGNGDGTFDAQTTTAVGNAPASLVVGDFNGDDKVDVAALNQAGNSISVLLGKGDGTFDAPVDLAVGSAPSGFAAADFNGDGLTDLVSVNNATPGTVGLLLSEQTETATITGVTVPEPTTHYALASYPGDSNHSGSQSSTVPLTGFVAIPTTTALTASPNPAVLNQVVTFTATVGPIPTGATLGTVSFYNGTTLLGTVALNASGVATLTTGTLPAGSATITAVYSGNTGFAGSTSAPLTEIIQTPTTTVLSASPNPVVAEQSVTFTATVSPTPNNGTVSFYNGSTLLGTATVNASGVATLSSSSLQAGTASITAVYSGTTLFLSSTSSPLTLTVSAATAYTVTAPPTPFTVRAGNSVDINVNVPPVGGAFNNVVTMSATGLPPGATVSFNPPTVIPGTTGAPTVMTIHTVTQRAGIPANQSRQFPFGIMSFAAGMCMLAAGRKRARRILLFALIAIGVFGTVMLSGCSGGFRGPVQQDQTYVITVTGTSGSLHPSATVTLTVKGS